MKRLLVVDKFCLRQFAKDTENMKCPILCNVSEFEEKVNSLLNERGGLDALKPGYAPFCKHFFVPNFTETPSYTLMITEDNARFLKSDYKARSEQELAVLERWFPMEDVKDKLQKAQFLDCILYSREQIIKENEAMGVESENTDAPYGIVSIKPQDVDHELPMNPITMMRNALGREEGGSGVNLQREQYRESVHFWKAHANVM